MKTKHYIALGVFAVALVMSIVSICQFGSLTRVDASVIKKTSSVETRLTSDDNKNINNSKKQSVYKKDSNNSVSDELDSSPKTSDQTDVKTWMIIMGASLSLTGLSGTSIVNQGKKNEELL